MTRPLRPLRSLPPGVTIAEPVASDVLAEVSAQLVNMLVQRGTPPLEAIECVLDAIAEQLAVGGILLSLDGEAPVRLIVIDGELCFCADAVAEA
jgi:hypothetical protein